MCGCPSRAPHQGTWPATQVGTLTGNQTGDPLLHISALNPLSHTSQGYFAHIFEGKIRMLIIHGGIMIIYPGYNNPVYNVHENVGAHYAWEHIIHGKTRCIHTAVY